MVHKPKSTPELIKLYQKRRDPHLDLINGKASRFEKLLNLAAVVIAAACIFGFGYLTGAVATAAQFEQQKQEAPK